MKKLIILIILVLVFSFSVSAMHYSILLKQDFKTKTFSTEEISLVAVGPDRKLMPDKGYNAITLAFNQSRLDSLNFSTKVYDTYKDVIFVNLDIPYYAYAKEVRIYNSEERLAHTIDLSEYATCDQDMFCDMDENILNCPDDCSKKSLIEPIIAKKTVKDILPQVTKEKPTSNTAIVIGIIILLIVLIVLIIRLRIKKT